MFSHFSEKAIVTLVAQHLGSLEKKIEFNFHGCARKSIFTTKFTWYSQP